MKQKGIAMDAGSACHKRVGEGAKGGTTPVATERVRKLLEIGRIASCRCAKECVIS
jgi:hypothetical protein